MEVNTENFQLNSKIILRDRANSPFSTQAQTLAITKIEDEVIECRLTLQINPEFYQRIETEALFNLKPEIRIPLNSENFSPDGDIQIEISLQPEFLPKFKENFVSLDDISINFCQLNQEQPDCLLFTTENWLLLSALQSQTSGKVGYRTLWHYLSPATLTQAATSGKADPISEALVTFFKEWTQSNVSAVTEEATAKLFDGISDFFTDFANFNFDELKKLFNDIEQQFIKNEKSPASNKTILQEILNFFTEDDWKFTKLPGESVLQIPFQGENGRWNCYAQAREDNKQFVFYSLSPITAPEEKRLAIAEFISRANYGMMIGNFELDFNDGEIRYKTSIDISGDNLSFALIKNLVYTNVSMMDKYLPGIMSVIQGDASPEQAITKIETTAIKS